MKKSLNDDYMDKNSEAMHGYLVSSILPENDGCLLYIAFVVCIYCSESAMAAVVKCAATATMVNIICLCLYGLLFCHHRDFPLLDVIKFMRILRCNCLNIEFILVLGTRRIP